MKVLSIIKWIALGYSVYYVYKKIGREQSLEKIVQKLRSDVSLTKDEAITLKDSSEFRKGVGEDAYKKFLSKYSKYF
jgi:hypothetical protein